MRADVDIFFTGKGQAIGCHGATCAVMCGPHLGTTMRAASWWFSIPSCNMQISLKSKMKIQMVYIYMMI